MKTIFSFLIIGLLFLTACTTQSSSPPTNEEATPPTNEEQPATPEPEPEPEPVFVEVPLSYEVVDSFLEQDSFNERRTLIIGGEVIQDEVVEVFSPIGCVTVKNTDDTTGEFTVHFTFYALDKFTAEAYEEVFGELDDSFIKTMGTEYSGSIILMLEPAEEAIAKYTAHDVSMEEDEWLWEFEVIPSTKLIEQ